MSNTSPVTLYIMPGACSLASHIALIWAGLPYTIAQLDHETVHSAFFMAINPKGAVPALVLENNRVITESLAVLQYVADCAPDAELGAKSNDLMARTKLNECLADLVSNVHSAWGPFMAPSRFVTEKSYQDDAREAALLQIDKQYRRMDKLIGDSEWLLFNRRTVADAYLYVMCSLKDKTPQPLADYPHLAAYKARLDQDPGIMRAISEEIIAY